MLFSADIEQSPWPVQRVMGSGELCTHPWIPFVLPQAKRKLKCQSQQQRRIALRQICKSQQHASENILHLKCFSVHIYTDSHHQSHSHHFFSFADQHPWQFCANATLPHSWTSSGMGEHRHTAIAGTVDIANASVAHTAILSFISTTEYLQCSSQNVVFN